MTPPDANRLACQPPAQLNHHVGRALPELFGWLLTLSVSWSLPWRAKGVGSFSAVHDHLSLPWQVGLAVPHSVTATADHACRQPLAPCKACAIAG